MKQILKHLTFTLSRSKLGGWITWFILRYFPFLIPFKKLYKDQFIIAIPHPVPCYKTHILLMPRTYLPDFLALDPKSETGKNAIQSVFQVLRKLCKEMEHKNMQLVINGGDYQDVKLLHIHLIENEYQECTSKISETDFNFTSLESLFSIAWEHIQKTRCSAYRFIFQVKKGNKIQYSFQTKPSSSGEL